MRVHQNRKIFLFGRYSLAVLLPKKWLSALEIRRNDIAELELDRKRRRVVIRFNGTAAVEKSTTLFPTKRGKKIASKNPTDRSNSDKDSDNSGWEPIPPL